MNIPNQPTDNLYKFLAISGLILLVLSVAVPAWSDHQFKLAELENDAEIALLDMQARLAGANSDLEYA
jgi:hypothetical protein